MTESSINYQSMRARGRPIRIPGVLVVVCLKNRDVKQSATTKCNKAMKNKKIMR